MEWYVSPVSFIVPAVVLATLLLAITKQISLPLGLVLLSFFLFPFPPANEFLGTDRVSYALLLLGITGTGYILRGLASQGLARFLAPLRATLVWVALTTVYLVIFQLSLVGAENYFYWSGVWLMGSFGLILGTLFGAHESPKKVRPLLEAFAFVTSLIVLLYLATLLLSEAGVVETNANFNYLARLLYPEGHITVALPIALAATWFLKIKSQTLATLISGVLFLGILLNGSRAALFSGLLIVLAQTALALWEKAQSTNGVLRLPLFALFAPVFGAAAYWLFNLVNPFDVRPGIAVRQLEGPDAIITNQRFDNWALLLAKVIEKPFFGWGFGNYEGGNPDDPHPHNLVVELLHGMGLSGTLLALALPVLTIVGIWVAPTNRPRWRVVKPRQVSFSVSSRAYLTTGIAAIFFVSSFIPVIEFAFPTFWLMWGVIQGSLQRFRARS
jgi:hypothetical protein